MRQIASSSFDVTASPPWAPGNGCVACARSAGLNVSALTQAAITSELSRLATDAWLDSLPTPRRAVAHETALAALDQTRDEFGARA